MTRSALDRARRGARADRSPRPPRRFDSDASAAAALAALVGAGLPVAEFAAATGLLEHTFLDLEGGRS
ncbi:hypothetical protein [Microbacterium lacticum]|uniref:hypothetical protein n=1 Tax=Microbacterium lacticum TaxID=33885 RepID=UPI003D36AC58